MKVIHKSGLLSCEFAIDYIGVINCPHDIFHEESPGPLVVSAGSVEARHLVIVVAAPHVLVVH